MAHQTDAQRDALRRKMREHRGKLPASFEPLARAVLGESEPDMSHEECLAALPSYVDAEIAGERIADKFPRIKQHLDLCEECSTQYAELLEVTLAAQEGEIRVSDVIPEPDLGFLRDAFSDFVIEKAQRILRTLPSASLSNLTALAEVIFAQIEARGGKFVLQPGLAHQLALDTGELSQATIALALSYAATQRLVQSLTPAQIDTLQTENRLQSHIEEIATTTAQEIQIETSLAKRLAREYARLVGADVQGLRALSQQHHP